MELLGISKQQTDILRSVKLGESYEEIATRYNCDILNVVTEEMRALAILSKRWRWTEERVKDLLRVTLLVTLTLIPLLEGQQFTRNLNAKTAKTSKTGGARRQEFGDFAIIEV